MDRPDGWQRNDPTQQMQLWRDGKMIQSLDYEIFEDMPKLATNLLDKQLMAAFREGTHN